MNLNELNVLEIKENPTIINDSYQITLQNCVPRPELGYFQRPKAKKGRAPWSLPKSIFKDYIADTEVILNCDKAFIRSYYKDVSRKIGEE